MEFTLELQRLILRVWFSFFPVMVLLASCWLPLALLAASGRCLRCLLLLVVQMTQLG